MSNINICYFFLTDQIKKRNVIVKYCPTIDMIGNFMTKLLQGKLFEKQKKLIMGNLEIILRKTEETVLIPLCESTGVCWKILKIEIMKMRTFEEDQEIYMK